MDASGKPVFLSYASQDTEAARRLCDALRAAGLEVWFDQSELRGGDAWDASIRKQVKECALFVPVISANTNARSEGYFRLEWKLAVDRSHLMADDQAFLLPVVIDDTPEPTARVPDRFRERQWSRLVGGEAPAVFAERVRRLLAGGAAPPMSAPRAAPAAASAAAAAIHEAPSIAVLPFANMSADPDNEYFSDGLSEELLNVLAKNPGLKVTGRTSSFAFKGKHEDLRGIGQKLGVATLLEGSVRKAGNRVRITAQLLKASDGFHLWSETYDRVLDDIFAVQDDIARSVASALDVALLGRPLSPEKGNAKAFDLILQANHCTNQSTEPSLAKAVTLYQEALALVPDDARAWAGLAGAYMLQAAQGFAGAADGYRRARKAVEKALALDDTLAEAYQSLGFILSAFEFRWAEADDALRKARALAPGNGNVLATSALIEAIRGRPDEALRLSERATELDPLSAKTHLFRARVLGWNQRYDEAILAYRKATELSPGITTAHAAVGNVLVFMGRPAEAVVEAAREPSAGYRNWALAIAHHALGDAAASDQTLAALIAEGEEWGFQVACVHAFRGEVDKAFDWLERAYFLRDSGVPLARLSRQLETLHADPRWPRFLQRVGLGS